ncbi:NUDIX domain-containing protein [Xylanimonas allomyrinae]|uniref:NUDIX domain-containing protein n=1 Tax=Xylanimonas allomyrinae TaxID=2509459 RepID=UPI001FE2C202|nr:NUDIX domain-containing protein [Xylanimonas allomyrinae]
MRTRESIECWVLAGSDLVLLLHVAAGAFPPDGFWQPVTGGIERDESPRDAAVREVWEETALRLEPDALVQVAEGVVVPISDSLQVVKTLFVVHLRSPVAVTTSPDEHDGHRWCPRGDVGGALTWESNRSTWGLVRN